MKIRSFLRVVSLGSIRELAAESCSEIKASEGNEMVNRKYWIYSDENSEVIEAYCEGKIFHQLIRGRRFDNPTASLIILHH